MPLPELFHLKFIYSEKATKFFEISTFLLSGCTVDKREVEISKNVVAFLEYTNFTKTQFKPTVTRESKLHMQFIIAIYI